MSEAAAARWVARAWTLLALSSAFYFLADNEADNDLWVHLFSGREILNGGTVPRIDTFSYTANGLPWVDHEWLAQAAYAAVFAAVGPAGLWLGKLLVALLTAAVLWRSVARYSRSAWVRGPLLVLLFATLARGYAIRPQIVTYLAVAVLLARLDEIDESGRRAPAWRMLAVIGIGFALWANAHAGFIVGIGILGLYAALPRWPWRDDGIAPPPLPLRCAILGVAAAAACITPYGPSLFAYIAGELQAPHPLTEWQPVALGDAAHLPFQLLLIAVVVTLPFARMLRERPWRAAVVAIVAVMALRHQRHTPLLALCAAAPLAEQAEAALAWAKTKWGLRLSLPATAVVGIAVLGLALTQLVLRGTGLWQARGGIVYLADEYPVGALRYLRERGVRGNLALPLDWGGYALWHAAPAIRVSLDGRFATLYPPAVVADNFAFFAGDGARLLDAYETDLLLVPSGATTTVSGRAGWHTLHADAVATLLGKREAAGGRGDAPSGWLPFP